MDSMGGGGFKGMLQEMQHLKPFSFAKPSVYVVSRNVSPLWPEPLMFPKQQELRWDASHVFCSLQPCVKQSRGGGEAAVCPVSAGLEPGSHGGSSGSAPSSESHFTSPTQFPYGSGGSPNGTWWSVDTRHRGH